MAKTIKIIPVNALGTNELFCKFDNNIVSLALFNS